MISLKWIKSLTSIYWLKTNLYQNCIWNNQNLLIVFVDHHRERIQNFRKVGNLKHLYRNKLDQACFTHDVAYYDSEDLSKRTISAKILKERADKVARNCKNDGYQWALASMLFKIFDKRTGSGTSTNEEIAEELHKPVIKKSKWRQIYARLKDNIWAADLAEMRSLSSKNKNVKYFLCVINVFIKYAWVKPFKEAKGKTVLPAFIKIVHKSNRKPSKL